MIVRGVRLIIASVLVAVASAACVPEPPPDNEPPPASDPAPTRPALGADHLDPGQGLYAATNDSLQSDNDQYRLVLQSDGNLVLYVGANRVLWATHTGGNPDAVLSMRMDGNLVLSSSAHGMLWASDTHMPGSRASLGDDGNLIIFSSANTGLWVTATHNDRLMPGETLVGARNQHISSANGSYALVMQADGNLVLYESGGSWLWFSNTAWQVPLRLVMREDGNLAIVASNDGALWETYTHGAGSYLVVQDDGDVVIYSPEGQALWSTRTGSNN